MPRSSPFSPAVLLLLVVSSIAALGQPLVTRTSPDGTRLLGPDGAPLVLRGVNWGWWNCVESGDADLLRALGGNLVRISFSHSKIVVPGTSELGGEGLVLLDAMVDWAEDAGLWYVLNCMETPGGCNPAPYCLGGRNALWSEPAFQTESVRLWDTLGRRYRERRHLLAYELMNEPTPPPEFPTAQYKELLLRHIDALRGVDPERFIVVSGREGWSGVAGLNDELLLPRPRLLYTFHFYTPGSVAQEAGAYPGPATLEVTWIGNSPEGFGASGEADWAALEKAFTAPGDATHGTIMLRSDSNSGSAWFDDLSLTCDEQPVAFVNPQFGPEVQTRGWKVMRQTAGQFGWDEREGHAAPGSLLVSATDSYNAWTTEAAFAVRPGARYTLRCWAKTHGASGWTYPAVAWFRHREEAIDPAWLEARIRPALDFATRNRVPIWCGEFGCSQSNPDGSGVRWPRDVGMILNRLEIPWTYWNWRETLGRGSMAVWVQDDGRYVAQRPLLELLRGLLAEPPPARTPDRP